MKKWEYTTLKVFQEKIEKVNGRDVGEVEHSLFVSTILGPDLHTYLNKMGQEGWEVVGMTPATPNGKEGGYFAYIVVLKRPLYSTAS